MVKILKQKEFDPTRFPWIVETKYAKDRPVIVSYFKSDLSAHAFADKQNSLHGLSAQAKFNPQYVNPHLVPQA